MRGQRSLWGRGARRTLEYSRWLSVSDMVPRRGDLNSQTALRVLALVLMSGHCRGGSKMPLQSRPITAMWANMELGLAGWMASSWPILEGEPK